MSVISIKPIKTLQLPETLVVFIITLTLPLLVHLIPALGNTPMGERLLPVFYAPLVATFIFRPHVSLLSAMLVPLINFMLTSRPAADIFLIIFVELLIFTTVSLLIVKHNFPSLIHVLLAYLAAKSGSLLWIQYSPLSHYSGEATTYFLSTMTKGLPGIAVLVMLAMIMSRPGNLNAH